MAHADQHSTYEQKLLGQGYKPLPEFAILDECDFHDKKTNQKVKFDKARLERLASNHNKLIEERESPPVICLGHTKDHVAEGEQPTVTGVATRFHVQQLRDGKHAVFVRPWAKPGHEKTFKDNPYRSVELWLDPDAVHPIALLGPTAPRRDGLGMHLFSRNYDNSVVTSSGSVVRFSREADKDGRFPILFAMRDQMGTKIKFAEPGNPTEPKDDEDETDTGSAPPAAAPADDAAPDAGDDTGGQPTDSGDPEFDKKLGESSTMKAIMATLMKISAFVEKAGPIFDELEQEATGAPPGGAPGGPPPGAPPDAGMAGAGAPPPGAAPPDAGPPPADAGAGAPPPSPDREGPPKKNSAGSVSGYGNTQMPNNTFAREPYAPYRAPAPAAPVDDPRVVQLQRQVSDLVKENAAIRAERIESEVDLALKTLAEEGYAVKVEIDKPALCKLKREDRAAHIEFMRETRAKKDVTPLPGGGRSVIVDPEQPMAIKFEREGGGVMGDPALAAGRISDDYEELVKMAGTAKKQGFNLKDFDVSQLTPAHANGVKVR